MDRSGEIRKKRDEIQKKLKEAEKELDELRKSCKHSEFKIKDINFGRGTLELRRVCKFCEQVLGFPNKEDLINSGYSR